MREIVMRALRGLWAVPSLRMFCAGLLGASLGTCSLVTDTSKNQCTSNTDCTDLFGPTAPFVCDVESAFCVRPPCEEDGDCRALGANFQTSICGTDKLCAAAQCTVDEECGVGGVCNAANRCEERQCRVVADCQVMNPSPTVQCVGGRCIDEVWGCVGKPDDRTTTMPTATVKLPWLELISRKPIEGTVTACLLPQLDPAPNPGCTPVGGAEATLDSTAGMITVTNLAQGVPIRIHYVPKPAPSLNLELMPTDFYSQKTPKDVTEYPTARIPYVTVVQALSVRFDPPVAIPLESAGATINIFDCRGMPAAGVFLRELPASERLEDTRITYFGEGGLPNPAQQETDASGLASVINMKQGITVTLKADIRGTPFLGTARTIPMTEFPVILYGSRMAIIELHPRKYRQN